MEDYIYLLGSPKFARKFDLLKGYSQVREKKEKFNAWELNYSTIEKE